MRWKQALNDGLRRATGFELQPATFVNAWRPTRGKAGAVRPGRRRRVGRPLPGARRVESPVFILSSLRSGSTLLRVILNSHSQIHAPHEFHLRHTAVAFTSKWAVRAMRARGLNATALEYLLWDRILDRDLERSGKDHIVVKTPNDVFNVGRIVTCWPDARFIFLLRHPAAIARSRAALKGTVDLEKNSNRIRRYCEALERARKQHPGHMVRYEELTSNPQAVVQGLCEFLDVPWEPEMLGYGRFDHGAHGAGLGDWKAKIQTGLIQPPAPLPEPEEIPPALRPVAAAWGYLSGEGQAPSRLEAVRPL